jgi:hypothetical protein
MEAKMSTEQASGAPHVEGLNELLSRMNPRIADLLVRMMEVKTLDLEQVRAFRDELVELNQSAAKSDEEQNALAFAFTSLMNRTETEGLISPDAIENFRNLRKSDYLMLMIVQATTDGMIDPDRLEYVTAREVEQGRLAADDDFRQHAMTGAATLGKTATPKKGFLGRLFGR